MNKILFAIALFMCTDSHCQKTSSLVTKLFFEYGFDKTKVIVKGSNAKGSNNILLSKKLSTSSHIGYAFIFRLYDKQYKTLDIIVGEYIKKIQLHPGKFYLIQRRDNELIIEEVDQEAAYI